MERCHLCNGRIIHAPEGIRCMNPRCEGSKGIQAVGGGVTCSCGEPMQYTGLNLYGEPNYSCPACGVKQKL